MTDTKTTTINEVALLLWTKKSVATIDVASVVVVGQERFFPVAVVIIVIIVMFIVAVVVVAIVLMLGSLVANAKEVNKAVKHSNKKKTAAKHQSTANNAIPS